MEKKIIYPELFPAWSPMRKICWIQEEYGKFNEAEERFALKEDAPDEIKKMYEELWDSVEAKQNAGYDVD